MKIFLTNDQINKIKEIDQLNTSVMDKQREKNMEQKPWKFKSGAFIDKKLYCYFENNKPLKLIYCDKNLGCFCTENIKQNLIERKLPHEEQIDELLIGKQLDNFIIVSHPYTSDGCCSGSIVEIYDGNVCLAKINDLE